MNHPTKRSSETSLPTISIPLKRCRQCDYTKLLPDELLIYIFSFFTHIELFTTLRRVCKRWYYLTASKTLWKKLSVSEKVPLSILFQWLDQSPLLIELELIGRNDINAIAKKVASCCKNLQSLKIDSKGNENSELLESKTLCRMLKNCKYLTNLYFSGVKILSCKFFEILSKRKPLGSPRKCSYHGPVSQKQMKALVTSIVSNDNYDVATLFTSGNRQINIKNIPNTREELPDIEALWNDIIDEFDDEDYDYEVMDENFYPLLGEDNLVA